jgi:hypothetical protein
MQAEVGTQHRVLADCPIEFRGPVVNLSTLQRLPRKFLVLLAFVAAGLISVLIAWGASILVEKLSVRAVRSLLATEGVTYAQVEADGLQIHLIGTAPNEAARYRLVNMVGGLVDSSRIRDNMDVTAVKAIEAPRFSVEILRNDDGIQMIGHSFVRYVGNGGLSGTGRLGSGAGFRHGCFGDAATVENLGCGGSCDDHGDCGIGGGKAQP